jgi:hypothetical protein
MAMAMDTTQPDDLMILARGLWDRRRRGDRGPSALGNQLIGELPVGGAQVVTVHRICPRGRVPIVSFRHWMIAPDGTRLPMKSGMNLSANVLAQFGGVIAVALQVEIDDMARIAEYGRPNSFNGDHRR